MIKEKNISYFALIYTLIFSILLNIIDFPEIIKSLIAQPSLLFIPYLFGRTTLSLFRKLIKIGKNKNLIIEILIEWSFGVICLILLEVFLYTNYLFNLNYYTVIVLAVCVLSLFVKDESNYTFMFNYKDILTISLLSLLFSIFISYFWKYPYANENDYMQHLFLTVKIIEQNRPIIFHSTYLPTMHTLYALAIKIFNIDIKSEPLMIFWATRFILYPIYAIGMYILSFQIIKNRFLSIYATFIGTFLVHTLENFFLPWSIAPKNIVSILFIFGMYYCVTGYEGVKEKNMNKMIIYLGVLYSFSFFLLYVSNIKGIQNYLIGIYLLLFIIIALGSSLFLNINKKMFFEIFIVIILLIFFHSVNGFLGGMLILLTIFIISNFNEINIKNKKILVFVISLFSAASIMLWYKGILYYPDASIFNVISSNTYLFGPDKTLDLFLGIYPKILILLFLISYIIIFKEKKDIILFSYGITAVLLFLFFFPISTSYRFLMYAHPFFIILVAYAIYRIFSTIKIKPVKILFLFCIILFSLINLYDKNLNTLQNPTISNLQDNFEIFEIGKFLKNNSEDNSIVICSEWYQTYSSNYGLTDRIFLWENGNFREDLVRDIYLSSSSEQAYASILNLIKNKNYIVGYVDNKEEEVRRFYKYPSEVYILYDDILARYLGDSNSIEKFFDTTYFELVYTKKNLNGNNFYVFKLKI